MPCIWGKHDKSQLFLNVAILPVNFQQKWQQGDAPILDTRGSPPFFKALIDTGAQSTCITKHVAEKVQLSPIGKTPVHGVSGIQEHDNFLFHVGFIIGAEEKKGDIVQRNVHVLDKEIQGPELKFDGDTFNVLLGMDIISIGSLKVEGSGDFSFSF